MNAKELADWVKENPDFHPQLQGNKLEETEYLYSDKHVKITNSQGQTKSFYFECSGNGCDGCGGLLCDNPPNSAT